MSSNRLQFTPGVWVALAVTLLLWASAYAGIRAGLRGYSPADLATLRFIVASVALGIYALLAHFRRPALRDLPGLILAGIVGITFYNIALNYGETRVTAGSASMLIASAPIWTTLLAVFFLHEHLSSLGWIGILLSFVGVALIASGEGGGIHLSPQAFIILACAVASAVYMILQKHFLSRYTPLEFTAYSIWAGTY
jgi:drug/metabolite transporter (DMT)-like permease